MRPKQRRIVAGSAKWLRRARTWLTRTGEVVIVYDKRMPHSLVRKQLYSEFPQLQIEELAQRRTSGEFLVLASGIRTKRAHYVDPNVRESYPESIELQPVSGFDPDVVPDVDPDVDTGSADSTAPADFDFASALLHRCACCGEFLPLSAFNMRQIGEHKVTQPYCRPCMKAYKHWRYEFLKAHKAKSLKTAYSDGHSYNEEFRRWWYSNH